MTADQHDRLAAASQALTHATVLAFGLALAELQVDVADLGRIAPPPHTTLLSLLARIARAARPRCTGTCRRPTPTPRRHGRRSREACPASPSSWTKVTRQPSSRSSAGLAGLGPALGCYRETCARIFRAMNFDLENGAGE